MCRTYGRSYSACTRSCTRSWPWLHTWPPQISANSVATMRCAAHKVDPAGLRRMQPQGAFVYPCTHFLVKGVICSASSVDALATSAFNSSNRVSVACAWSSSALCWFICPGKSYRHTVDCVQSFEISSSRLFILLHLVLATCNTHEYVRHGCDLSWPKWAPHLNKSCMQAASHAGL